MYNPMYFLNSYSYDGCGSSTVAKYWRIRTGSLPVRHRPDRGDQPGAGAGEHRGRGQRGLRHVWGMKHVEAERTGDSTTNFIAWVNICRSAKSWA
jgi:hypothetical protein